jgi:hypothetical protein
MTPNLTRALGAVAAGALLIPAAAVAKPGKGNGHAYGHDKNGVPAPHAVVAPVVAPAPVAATVPAPAPAVAPAAKPTRAKPSAFVFKGRVTAVDAAANTVTVEILGGNARGRTWRGKVVTFALAGAVVEGVETDGVAGLTATDLLAGDRVTAHARLPRGAAADGTEVAARKLVDHAEREPVAIAEPVTEPITETPAE